MPVGLAVVEREKLSRPMMRTVTRSEAAKPVPRTTRAELEEVAVRCGGAASASIASSRVTQGIMRPNARGRPEAAPRVVRIELRYFAFGSWIR